MQLAADVHPARLQTLQTPEVLAICPGEKMPRSRSESEACMQERSDHAHAAVMLRTAKPSRPGDLPARKTSLGSTGEI